MSPQGFREVFRLLAYCYRAFEGLRPLMAFFIALSLVAAITEGFGISLLVPFLETAQGGAAFANNPIFGPILAWTRELPAEHRLSIVAGVLFAVVCIRGVLLYATQVLSEVLPLRLQRRLMETAYDGLLHVEVGYISRAEIGNLTESVGHLPIRISSLMLQVATGIFNAVLAVGYGLLMLAVSWKMTLAAIMFFMLITTLLRVTFSVGLRRAGVVLTSVSARNATLLHETVNGLKLIRLSSAEGAMAETFGSNTAKLVAARVKVAVLRGIASPLLSTAAGGFICALLAANEFLGMDQGGSWVISVLIFNVLIFRLLSPVAALNNARHYILADMHAFEEFSRLQDDLKSCRQRSGTHKITALTDCVRFDRVRFTYPGSDRPALDNFSLDIRKGEMVALVGPSGAGKSTVAALLARLYDPDTGSVFVDDVDLRSLDIASWHRLLGVVSQEAFIFNDTLANNLRFVRPGASDEELRAALRRAAADDIVQGLPDGLETMLGERGSRLSGGQVQRIALARVLLADPQFLILDEATSNLDSLTEAAIQRTIEEMRHERTILAVAHRLSTIVKADRIIVVENAGISAIGTHAELEVSNSLYREFLRHQVSIGPGSNVPGGAAKPPENKEKAAATT